MDGYQLLTIIENEELAYEDFTKCRRASAEYLGKIAALEKELKATKVLLECAQGMEDQAYKFFKECAAKSRKEPKRD